MSRTKRGRVIDLTSEDVSQGPPFKALRTLAPAPSVSDSNSHPFILLDEDDNTETFTAAGPFAPGPAFAQLENGPAGLPSELPPYPINQGFDPFASPPIFHEHQNVGPTGQPGFASPSFFQNSQLPVSNRALPTTPPIVFPPPPPSVMQQWTLETIATWKRVPLKLVECPDGYSPVVGELLCPHRSKSDPYNPNHINVLSQSGVLVGIFPPAAAALFASFIDQEMLSIAVMVTGQKVNNECPVDVLMTGQTPSRMQLMSVCDLYGRDQMFMYDDINQYFDSRTPDLAFQPGFPAQLSTSAGSYDSPVLLSSPAGPSAAPPFDPGAAQRASAFMNRVVQHSEQVYTRELDDDAIFGVLVKELEVLPKADQPEGINKMLLPHQLQGLKWMIDCENPQLPSEVNKSQLWHFANGRFHHQITRETTNEPPELARGGILADDMGLGKTLQVISLVILDRLTNLSKDRTLPKTTLVLAPVSVASVWKDQFDKHVLNDHKLKVLIYHGNYRPDLTPNTVKKYDVIISSYETAMSEWKARNPEPEDADKAPRPKKHTRKHTRKHDLFSVTWRRVVLDEGHAVRNGKSKKSQAVFGLEAWSRWVLTGTPIVNTLNDFHSFIAFLRLPGRISDSKTFSQLIAKPASKGSFAARQLLQELVRAICLRRTKAMGFIDLKLPPMTEYVHRIEFSQEEQEKYSVLMTEASEKLREYLKTKEDRGIGERSDKASAAYRKVLEVLMRLRQFCNHWSLCGEARVEGLTERVKELNPGKISAIDAFRLQSELQLILTDQEFCPVCTKPFELPVITVCRHAFCTPCATKAIEKDSACPTCKTKLHSASLVQPDEAPHPVDVKESSSKLETLVELLQSLSMAHPKNKTVLFSQWTSFLDIVQARLVEAKIGFSRLDGTMKTDAREDAIKRLNEDPKCMVLLASLAACSVGLNLTSANQVIMADSWWAPAIEDQAVDRVHRLGQTKETIVYRLVIDQSIEERVLKIQEKKRQLMRIALSDQKEARGKKKDDNRLGDIQALLAVVSPSRSQKHKPVDLGDVVAAAEGGKTASAAASATTTTRSAGKSVVSGIKAERAMKAESDDDDEDDKKKVFAPASAKSAGAQSRTVRKFIDPTAKMVFEDEPPSPTPKLSAKQKGKQKATTDSPSPSPGPGSGSSAQRPISRLDFSPPDSALATAQVGFLSSDEGSTTESDSELVRGGGDFQIPDSDEDESSGDGDGDHDDDDKYDEDYEDDHENDE